MNPSRSHGNPLCNLLRLAYLTSFLWLLQTIIRQEGTRRYLAFSLPAGRSNTHCPREREAGRPRAEQGGGSHIRSKQRTLDLVANNVVHDIVWRLNVSKISLILIFLFVWFTRFHSRHCHCLVNLVYNNSQSMRATSVTWKIIQPRAQRSHALPAKWQTTNRSPNRTKIKKFSATKLNRCCRLNF